MYVFVKPMDTALLDELTEDHSLLVTVEENVENGGFGQHVCGYMETHHPGCQVLPIAIPDRFVAHGSVDSLRDTAWSLHFCHCEEDKELREGIERMKKRLDILLVERTLAPSREKAKAYIMAGQVYVDGQKEDKSRLHVCRYCEGGGKGKYPSLCKPGRFEAGESNERI